MSGSGLRSNQGSASQKWFEICEYAEVRISNMQSPTILQGQAGTGDILIQFAPILIIGVIFYLLIFMPMRKRQKKLESMIGALRNGDRVITSSGIYGVVAGVKDKTLILKIADQVKIEVAKSAVAGLQAPEENPQSS
jgi:preprotein translocase subunit YajC